jgi:penicillin-binding protein 1A
MRMLARFIAFLFAAGAIVFTVGALAVGALVYTFSKDLPDHTQLSSYEPPVMTRVHASDGEVVAEYAKERRLYLPANAIPRLVKEAFISAEDKNFYTHHGIDPEGMLRAVKVLAEGNKRMQGASTITQQVAKNFLLTPERSFERKIQEALLSLRIEQTYSKEKILELYLNKINLGAGSYGIAAAALNYFDKSVQELTLAEAAYLAGLPKAPNNYNPWRNHDAAVERRNYVLTRMVENGYISRAEGEAAKADPLAVHPHVVSANSFAAGYFVEEVRRELYDRYGERKLYEGGLSVRTTLDPTMQLMARKALANGLVRFDEAHGYRGPYKQISIGSDWGPPLADIPALGDVAPWRLAVVLEVGDSALRVGLQPPKLPSGEIARGREIATVSADNARFVRKKLRQAFAIGDVIFVEPVDGKPGQMRLRQIPEISGAIVAMDPFTGRVFAMIGGFSFDQSSFNRATQAERQPGSSFKPFVYATALDNGYTPSSILLDEPIEIAQPNGDVWRPENFEHGNYGPHTLRYGVEHSKNLMTVRLARDIGMPLIAETARRFGVYDNMPPMLSFSLGAGETTLMRMVTGYSMLDNGGKQIKATLIDRIQDRWGHTIYRHDERECLGCDADRFSPDNEPKLVDKSEQVLDPLTAYQITSIMEGVIDRGTGVSIKELGKHLAGKTGTTNEAKDLWFIGYSPDLAVGVYLGYDKPRSMGDSAQAATYAAPIFRDYMKMALANKPDAPFRVPPGIKLISVDVHSGLRSSGQGSILEAFKPGTAPPDSYNGGGGGDHTPADAPANDSQVGAGTGGLY